MKSGEFARLCRTTKETLRHYDRIGLLSPAIRGQNGYRFYTVAQFADFSLISALQSTGLSLSEIQEFMNQPGSDALYDVLRERIDALENQRRELHRKQQVLESALAQAERLRGWLDENAGAQTAPGGYRWRIMHCDEEYFLETVTPYADGNEERFLSIWTTANHTDGRLRSRRRIASTAHASHRVATPRGSVPKSAFLRASSPSGFA